MDAGRISIIIPTLNEASRVARALDSARADNSEAIVVDGGSSDATPSIARERGATVLCSARGRARQMNLGAREASGEFLLFLHADGKLPEGYADSLRCLLSRSPIAGGAFRLGIESRGFGLRMIEAVANWRACRLQCPYGDQAIFTRRATFLELGGYPDLPIMEDFVLIRRLRHRGRIVISPLTVGTSARRWQSNGTWRTTLINQAVVLGYLAGLPPARLARLRSRGAGAAAPPTSGRA